MINKSKIVIRSVPQGMGDSVYLASSSSAYYCPFIGEYGKHEECTKSICTPGSRKLCHLIHSASCAPLCQLPEYMAHYMEDVRQAAKARFIELQEQEETQDG